MINNTYVKIIMSAILSRPIDFDRTKQLVIETNNCLAKLALKRNVQFVKTYKEFVKQPGSFVYFITRALLSFKN
jgi:hypothetical protein